MSDAGEARDRLAALLPAVGVRPPLRGPIGGVVVSMTPDRATALADEIEAGRTAVAAVARVEALADLLYDTGSGRFYARAVIAAGYVAPDDHARQVRDAKQEGAEAALAGMTVEWGWSLPQRGIIDRSRNEREARSEVARFPDSRVLVSRRVTDWQAADDA